MVYQNQPNQPKEMALSICNSISGYCFRLLRDWKLENLANQGNEISGVPFRTEKEGLPYNFGTDFRKITVPFDFQPKFPDFLT